jgi:hypothetical protein
MRMDIFAADVIHNPTLQREALNIASNGYSERHPEDYQGGIVLPKLARKNPIPHRTSRRTHVSMKSS